MVRKKVHTREQILKSTCELVEKDGFSKFTARNIAKNMGISTQPIYLEFKNMDDLKESVLEEIFDNLFNITLKKEHTGDPLVDLGISFIDFANTNKNLFRTLFVESCHSGQKTYDYSYQNYRNLALNSDKYCKLSEKQICILHLRTWILVTGLAALTSSGIIAHDFDKLATVIKLNIKNLIIDKKLISIG